MLKSSPVCIVQMCVSVHRCRCVRTHMCLSMFMPAISDGVLCMVMVLLCECTCARACVHASAEKFLRCILSSVFCTNLKCVI